MARTLMVGAVLIYGEAKGIALDYSGAKQIKIRYLVTEM